MKYLDAYDVKVCRARIAHSSNLPCRSLQAPQPLSSYMCRRQEVTELEQTPVPQ